MARSFSSSSNTDLSVSSGTPYVLGSGMSMACWVKPSSAASQHFFAYGPTSGYGYRLFTVVSGSVNYFHWKPGDNITPTVSASSYAFGSWHFVGGTTNNSNDHHLYVDTAESSTSWSVSPNTPVLLTIGQSNRYSSGNFDGDVAECAIWDAQLTATEMGMLAAGVSPLMVRPANLVFYCPCNHGDAVTDDEFDVVGGLTMAQTFSPGIVDHPPGIYYPASPIIGAPAPSGADVTFAANLTADADHAAALSIDRGIAANLTADANHAAALEVDRALAANLTVDADHAAELSIDRNLAANLTVDADLAAALTVTGADRNLAANLTVDADLAAALSCSRALSATLSADADHVAALTVPGSFPTGHVGPTWTPTPTKEWAPTPTKEWAPTPTKNWTSGG